MANHYRSDERRKRYQAGKIKRQATEQQAKVERPNMLFMSEDEVLARSVQVNNRIITIGELSKDEFIDWVYELIQRVGLTSQPGRRLEKELYADGIQDSHFRWYLVLEAYNVKPLRTVMFVQNQEMAS